jgi:hypothetical protein
MFKTAFSYTKQNFNKWPVIETDQMDSYDLADAYKDKVPYVWFVNPNYNIHAEFNWNFRPLEEQRFNVHSFPRCFAKSKKPINWDVVKIVPTNPNSRINVDIKQPVISSFVESEYPIYIYSFNDRFSTKKLLARPIHKKHRLIKSRKSLSDIFSNLNLDYIEDFVWLLDIDVDTGAKFYFDFVPQSDDTIYMFKVEHKSTGLVYGDHSVMLIPKKYITEVQDSQKTKIQPKFHYTEVDILAGTLDDITDPAKAWQRAFATASLLIQGKFPNDNKKLKNKIMASYISQHTSRMNDYVKDACECAVKKNENEYIYVDLLYNHQWLEDVFNQRQEFLRNEQSNLQPNRLEIIKKIYGENSEQYKAYEQKLKTV